MKQQQHRFDILSLFPNYFISPLNESIVKRAQDKGIIEINQINIRDFADNKHHRVDDRPFGGGPGMVLMPEPVGKAIRSVKTERAKVIYLSPQGQRLTAKKARELAAIEHLILLCGHYEGVDERIIANHVDEEISIGDYVLTDGCLSAIVLLNAVIRFIPGILGHKNAANEDSFENGIFDCPHYTKPLDYEGHIVPEILLSGNHQRIAEWRREQALSKTKRIRPDLVNIPNVFQKLDLD